MTCKQEKISHNASGRHCPPVHPLGRPRLLSVQQLQGQREEPANVLDDVRTHGYHSTTCVCHWASVPVFRLSSLYTILLGNRIAVYSTEPTVQLLSYRSSIGSPRVVDVEQSRVHLSVPPATAGVSVEVAAVECLGSGSSGRRAPRFWPSLHPISWPRAHGGSARKTSLEREYHRGNCPDGYPSWSSPCLCCRRGVPPLSESVSDLKVPQCWTCLLCYIILLYLSGRLPRHHNQ